MNLNDTDRRQILQNLSLAGAAIAVAGALPINAQDAKKKTSKEPEVTATEDLMREHGVIRRALLIYHETVPLLRTKAASVDAAALYKTAQLFRRFGEDYHERMLEETHIFPIVRKLSGRAGKYPDVLEAQHRRGRGDHRLHHGRHETWKSRYRARRAAGEGDGGAGRNVRASRRTRRHNRFPGVEGHHDRKTA